MSFNHPEPLGTLAALEFDSILEKVLGTMATQEFLALTQEIFRHTFLHGVDTALEHQDPEDVQHPMLLEQSFHILEVPELENLSFRDMVQCSMMGMVVFGIGVNWGESYLDVPREPNLG